MLQTQSSNSTLLKAFNCLDVEYFVVGGMAVHFHCPERYILGKDLDLLVNHEEENAIRAAVAFEFLKKDGIMISENKQELLIRLTKPYSCIWLKQDLFADVLTSPKEFDFSSAFENSIEGEINGIRVQIASCSDLVSLKTIAYKNDRNYKDLKDLARLRKKMQREEYKFGLVDT